MWNIVEIFDGIQGEGEFTGTPSTFIRFYGCNLECSFCDEPLHTQHDAIIKMSTDEILHLITQPHVVITGGEPSLQDINPLIRAIQEEKDARVQVETNGYNIYNIRHADWITYSPKIISGDKKRLGSTLFNEIKVPCSEEFPPDKTWDYVYTDKYLQPISDGDELNIDNIQWVANYILEHPEENWKLSIQTHKIYGGK